MDSEFKKKARAFIDSTPLPETRFVLSCPVCCCDISRDAQGRPETVNYIRILGSARWVCSQACEDYFYAHGHEAKMCPHKDGLELATEGLE